MKVETIALRQVLPFNDTSLDLHNKFNVFTGVNGSGKSLILRLIKALFKKEPNSDQSVTPHIQAAGEVGISYSFDGKPFTALSKGSNNRDGSQIPRPRMISAQEQQIAKEFQLRTQPSSYLIPPNNAPILVFIESARGQVGVHSPLENAQWRSPATSERFNHLLRLYEIIFDQEGGLERKYQDLLQEFFPYMASVIKIRSRAQNQRVMDVKSFECEHDGYALASGCLEILFIVGETAFLKDSIILLDEPELHLHPLAQDKMCNYLHYLTTPEGGGNQVIVATHSISLIYGGREGKVINLRREDNRVTPEVVIENGEPALGYSNALAELGYSGHAITEAREFYRSFRAKKPDYQPPAEGGWSLGD